MLKKRKTKNRKRRKNKKKHIGNKFKTKQMREIKEFLLYVLVVLLIITVFYLGVAFITLDFNPVNWSTLTRLLIFLNSFVFSCLGGLLLRYYRDN